MAIGYENMDYSIDSASTSSITVSRLTDTGAVDGSWPGFDFLTSSSVVIYISSTDAAIGWAGPFTACPAGEVTEKIEYDLFFPNGLWETFGQGGSFPESQTIEIQWREAGSSDAWESEVKTVKTRSRDQIGYTFSIDLASAMRPEVRMRRAGAASTAFKFRDVEWYGLRAKLDAPSSYPWTTISVEVEDAEEIAGASENQINVIAKRKIPVLSGGEWTAGNVETADIIPALRYMAESISMPYDDDAMVSLDSLYKSRGDTFNYVFQESTLREAMKTALGAGMAELTLDDGAIKPIRDGVRTTFEQAFSPQNMTGDGLSRSFTSVRPDEPDGVDVEYTDSQTWAQQTVECRLPGDFGDKVETLKLSGVTNRTQAWRIGMRYRRQQKYRRWDYSFNTELEGLNAGYMSYVPLLDDIPGYGQSSIMRNIAAIGDDARITVTEDMDWSGTGHVVAFRNEYGELVGPYSASMGNNNREIVADIPVDVWPDLTERQEPPHVYFGTSDKWTFPALIQSIEPSGGLQVGIRAVNYDERVYADDDNAPPE
ncbi:host specificity factor TipJ family phage tail protein [Alcanivorax sp. IL1]